ncbi:hypothetical protein Cgig2_005933 [Carnegiea gigantea]|uniref:Aminotransferase-like plant mobile domain-containing protein n=1 Tax=Carnegiea gigantea TaxID=171969 RepID=A0A9Q1KKD4_9CARY|nr:hypothetical protein Cgig2_005933 [Carnegiea gigantea]
MVTFMGKTTSRRRYLHIQPSENNADGEETKLPICNPITSLCKSDCVRGPLSFPWWSKENLKTGKTFLLSTYIKIKENLPFYQLLHHDIESELKSWAKLPLYGEFSYKSLYWKWLEDILVRCKDKLTTFHLFGRKGKLTIEQWISFWSRGRNKYHVSKKPDQHNRIPHPGILSSFTDAGAHGWSDCQAIFDKLGVAIGQRTETFLAAFLSCWLCTFILPVRDTGCIHPGTFSIASLMASGIGYCLARGISIYSSFVSYRCEDNLVMEHYCPDQFSSQFGFYQDVPADLDFDNLLDPETRLRYHHMLTRYGTGSQVLLSGRCKLGSKSRSKIVRFGKPLEPFVPPMEDGYSRVKILGIDVVILATPIPAILIQSIAPLPQDELPVEVCEPSTKNIIEFPPEGAENIMDILDAEPNPTECMGVCCPDDDVVESIRKVNAPSLVPHPQRPLRAPQGGISVFNADAVIKEVDKNAA